MRLFPKVFLAFMLLACLLFGDANFAQMEQPTVLPTDIVYVSNHLLDRDTWRFDINRDYSALSVEDVAYGKALDLWIGIHRDGTYLSSKDGLTWTKHSTGFTAIFSKIEYANGVFIMGGDSLVIYSKDGLHWEKSNFIMDTTWHLPYKYQVPYQFFVSLNHDGKRFILTEGSFEGMRFYESEDGAAWRPLKQEVDYIKGVGGGPQVIQGDSWLIASGNRITKFEIKDQVCTKVGYQDLSLPKGVEDESSFVALIWDGYQYVALGNEGTLAYSDDGLNWRLDSNALGKQTYIKDGKVDQTSYLDYSGMILHENKLLVYGSVDAVDWGTRGGFVKKLATNSKWSMRDYPQYWPTLKIAENGLLVGIDAVSDGVNQIYTSKNGLEWTLSTTSLLTKEKSSSQWHNKFAKVYATKDRYFLTDEYGSNVHSTVDGKMLQPIKEFYGLTAVAGSGNKYVAISTGGGIYYEGDGKTFKPVTIGKKDSDLYGWNSVASFGTKWCVVGENGKVGISSDGVKWSLLSTGTKLRLNSVIHDGKQLIASGEQELILVSTDGGKKWTQCHKSNSGYQIEKMIYGNGLYAAIVKDYSTENKGFLVSLPYFLYSKDGVKWEAVELNTNAADMTFMDNHFMMLSRTTYLGSTESNADFKVSKDLRLWTKHYHGLGYNVIQNIASIPHHFLAVDNYGELYMGSQFRPEALSNEEFKGTIIIDSSQTVPKEGLDLKVTVSTRPQANETTRELAYVYVHMDAGTNVLTFTMPVKLNEAEMKFWNYDSFLLEVEIPNSDQLLSYSSKGFNRDKILKGTLGNIYIHGEYFTCKSSYVESLIRKDLEQPEGKLKSEEVNKIKSLFPMNFDSAIFEDLDRMNGLRTITVFTEEYDKIKDWDGVPIFTF